MTTYEKCPKCGGPVEKDEWREDGISHNVLHVAYRALPDTLEGIVTAAANRHNEAALRNIDRAGDAGPYAEVFKQALTRLFNGCAECGREPLGDGRPMGLVYLPGESCMTDRVEEIRQRVEKATRPWSVERNSSGGMTLHRGVEHPLRERHIQSHLQILPTEDALFIAHAREDIPWLLAEVERLSREREEQGERWSGIVANYDRRLFDAGADLAAARERLAEVSRAIGTVEYMDPPDGGSVTLAEQVARMRERVTALSEALRTIIASVPPNEATVHLAALLREGESKT